MARDRITKFATEATVLPMVSELLAQGVERLVIEDDRGGTGCWLVKYEAERQPETRFACVYCGHERTSPNGTGSDIRCCGEVGHVEPINPEEE